MKDVTERVLEVLGRDEPFLCALATGDAAGVPRVRYMLGIIDEELVIRLPTFADTKKVGHVRSRPEVCLACGETDSSKPGTYLHIEGRASVSTTEADRRAAWTSRLERWFTGPDDPAYAVLRIEPQRILALPIGGGPAAERWERAGSPSV